MTGRLDRVRSVGLFALGAILLATGISCLCVPTPTPPASSTVRPTLSPFGAIIADNVPVRSGPGDEYEMVGTCSRGDIVTLLGSEGEWYKIHSERFDADVWVYAKFVSPIVSRRPTPTAEEPTEPPPTPQTLVFTLPPEPSPSPTPTAESGATPLATESPSSTLPPAATETPLPTDLPTQASSPTSSPQPTLPPLPPPTRTPTASPQSRHPPAATATPSPTLPPVPSPTPTDLPSTSGPPSLGE